MLIDTPDQIRGNANIKCAITSTGKYINARLFFHLALLNIPVFWIPAFPADMTAYFNGTNTEHGIDQYVQDHRPTL